MCVGGGSQCESASCDLPHTRAASLPRALASGKMVCTGAKSEEDARTAARKYARIVKKLGFPAVKFKEFKIQNMVGSCDVKFPIRLEGLQYNNLFAK